MQIKTRQSMRLFILGATGRTGRELVDQALTRRHQVTAFVRTPEKLDVSREGLTVIKGDLLNANAVGAALEGHDAVLSAIGPQARGRTTITRDSAQATVAAMRVRNVRRLVILGAAMLFDDAGFVARILRKTLLREVAKDLCGMEIVVTASSLDWTIICPPRLTNGPLTKQYAVADDHLPLGAGLAAKISRSDVAHFVLDEVEQLAHVRRVVGMAYGRPVRQ